MRRLGLLIPSSNVVLEPLAAQLPDVSVHVSRLGVLDVTLAADSRAQFELDTQVAAARLLCDANVDAITWGGTSASWLGLDHDLRFVDRMQQETGVRTTTCVLEINRQLERLGARRLGMIYPYTQDVAEAINRNYQKQGFQIGAYRTYGGTISNDFASIREDDIEGMVRDVVTCDVDAIVMLCTNMHGAALARRLEPVLRIPDDRQCLGNTG